MIRMSREYDLYLQQHKDNVMKGYDWIKVNLPELLDGMRIDDLNKQILNHDASKSELDEYIAYDNWFYGNNRSFAVKNDFNHAWLRHIHRNKHHWQHWVLINDDPNEGEVILEMPANYILEMVCDWWAFSWNSGDLTEIFNWYNEHKEYIKLGVKTRKTVEDILDKISVELVKLGLTKE